MQIENYHVHRTALIDADYLAYSTAAWAHSHQIDQLEMLEKLQQDLDLWIGMACASDAILLFSCSRYDNFRRDHFPLYKANRTTEPPALLAAAMQLLRKTEWRSVTRPRIEADDIIGILMTNGNVKNPVCISRDKDLRQVPGWHLDPYSEDFPVLVDRDAGDYLFYRQWLTGDSVDGFGGIKGWGPKKADKLLMGLSPLEWEAAVCDTYQKAGISYDHAVAQARCARILQAEDWDVENGAPRPWSPAERHRWAPVEETVDA